VSRLLFTYALAQKATIVRIVRPAAKIATWLIAAPFVALSLGTIAADGMAIPTSRFAPARSAPPALSWPQSAAYRCSSGGNEVHRRVSPPAMRYNDTDSALSLVPITQDRKGQGYAINSR
jgi:hypothetical protein